MPAPRHDQRRAERLLVHETLVVETVFAQQESLIGGVDDQRVVHQAVFLQIVEHPADLVVHRTDRAAVIVYVTLVLPAQQLLPFGTVGQKVPVLTTVGVVPHAALFGRQRAHGDIPAVVNVLQSRLVLQLLHLEIEGISHVAVDRQLLLAHLVAARGVIVEKGFRLRELDILVQIEVLQVGHPVPVRGLVVDHQAERRVVVPARVEPRQSVVGNDVGGVSLLTDVPAAGFGRAHHRIVILPLIPQQVVMIEALGFDAQVPFAEDRRQVALGPEQFGEMHQRRIHNAVAERGLPVTMAVHAGQQGRPRRRRDRVFDERLAEKHPFARQPVDIGRRSQPRNRMPVGADGLISMVVGHDIDDIGPPGFPAARPLLRGACRGNGGRNSAEEGRREMILPHLSLLYLNV